MARLARIISFALIALLSGCATSAGLHPQGHQRDPGELAVQGTFAAVQISPATWPKSEWWRALGDPLLDALIAEALQNNPSLDSAEARAHLALAEAWATDAARQPTVSTNANASGIRIPSTIIGEPIGGHFNTLNVLSLKASYGFDLWGGKRAAWEAAVDNAHAAEVDTHAARLNLSSKIARTYAQLDYAFAQLDIAQHEVDRSTRAFDLTAQRVKAGIDSALQLKQTEAAVPIARQQLIAAQLQVTAARVALAALVGAGPDRGAQIERPHSLQISALALPSALPAELLARRPDVVAARWRSEAAALEINVAKTKFLPNFDLTAAAGLASLGVSELFTAQSRYYQIAPALSLPIFDGGRLRANLSGRDAQYDLAVAHYNQTLVDALHGIAADLATLGSLEAQAIAAVSARDTASAAFDLAMQRYRGGVGNYLDALVVQQQFLGAEQRVAALRAQQIDTSIQLIADLGGGYEPAQDSAAIESASAAGTSAPTTSAPTISATSTVPKGLFP
ncbi:MAG: efflux transporter outer membrane subunit [Dokdonella sp.]